MYGVKTSQSKFVSDLPYIRSDQFDTNWRLRVIRVCGASTGTYNAFTGINLVVSNEEDSWRVRLADLGSTTPCEKWVLPEGQHFDLV